MRRPTRTNDGSSVVARRPLTPVKRPVLALADLVVPEIGGRVDGLVGGRLATTRIRIGGGVSGTCVGSVSLGIIVTGKLAD